MVIPTYALSATNVSKRIKGSYLLRNAGIWIRAGAVTALLGRNGAGKTTLIEMAIGRRRPNDECVVNVGATRLSRPHLASLARRGVYYLPQDEMLIPHMTIGQHFDALVPFFRGSEVRSSSSFLDVHDMMFGYPHQLSGGERRRCELALAAYRRPLCLVADEPFGSLAPKAIEEVIVALRALASAGTGVLITTHDVGVIKEVADFAIWLTSGTTHDLGPITNAFEHSQVAREYMGHSHTGRW